MPRKQKRTSNPDEPSDFTKKEVKGRLLEILEVLARHEIVKGITPEKLRLILEDIGPTFVKIGQIMSMRQDILPLEYCEELAKLRTDVKPVPIGEIYGVLEEEYGLRVGEIFREFDPVPLGCASIAQVHAATLKDGKKVVVKVQRRGIKGIMARDIALLRKAAVLLKFAGGAGDTIDFSHVLDEMWAVTQQEMDFMIEAGNTLKFAELNQEILYVGCPRIEQTYTTTRALVMEFIDGIQIDDTLRLTEEGYDLDEIAEKLAENYIKQILTDSFFQADPHPGNLRVREGKIVWIDFGMMGQLSEKDRAFLKDGVKALAERDIFKLQDIVLSMGEYRGKINHQLLYRDIDDMVTKYAARSLGDLNLSAILQDFFTIAKSHGIMMPKGLTLLGRGIVTIEGVLSVLSSKISIIQIMMNHLKIQTLEDFDIRKKLEESGRLLYYSGQKAIEIPSQLHDLLKMTLKGQSKMNIEMTGSEEPLKALDKMVNKLALCMINAAILVGSSLICTTDMTPKILGIPLLGCFGYFTAMVLSGILMWDIIRKR